MTAYDATKIRNVSIIAHGGGGSTSLCECMLFNADEIKEMGSSDRGTAVMSTEPEEVDKGITITPHVGHFFWQGQRVNLIDSPGYVNFLEATKGVLHVTGSAVMMLSSISGVKSENERLWHMCQEESAPVLGFVNKMDRDRSDYSKVLHDIEQSFQIKSIPLTYPLGEGESFKGVIDILSKKAFDENAEPIEVPVYLKADVDHYHNELVEKIVESDDKMLEDYLEGTVPEYEDLKKALRESIMTRQFFPVLCGSTLKNIGVRELNNAIVDYLPSPMDKQKVRPFIGVEVEDHTTEIERDYGLESPMSAIVFKTTIDPYQGKFSYVRIFTGELNENSNIFNGTRREKEKTHHLFKVQGKEMQRVPTLYAGEMGAIAKLAYTQTGDTLCSSDAPIHYNRIKYAEPILSYAIDMPTGQEDKISEGLLKLQEEDPTMRVEQEPSTHELLLRGMGQTHVDVILARLERKYKVKAKLKTPKVPYKETITKSVKVQGKLKKQSGGHGQFAECWLEVAPLKRGEGFRFVNQITGGVIPKQFIPSIEKGVREAMSKGELGEYPVQDLQVTVYDGKYHSVDSSDYAFQVAGSLGLKEALKEAEPVLLEPMMSMEIVVPEGDIGEVVKDLNSRRGQVLGLEVEGHSQTVKARVPYAEVLEYGNALQGMTEGQGLYTMHLEGYGEVSSHLMRKVLSARSYFIPVQ